MIYRLVIIIGIIPLLVMTAKADEDKIASVRFKDISLGVALTILADTFQERICYETMTFSRYKEPLIVSLDVKEATLDTALKELLKQAPDYDYSYREAVVNVFPKDFHWEGIVKKVKAHTLKKMERLSQPPEPIPLDAFPEEDIEFLEKKGSLYYEYKVDREKGVIYSSPKSSLREKLTDKLKGLDKYPLDIKVKSFSVRDKNLPEAITALLEVANINKAHLMFQERYNTTRRWPDGTTDEEKNGREMTFTLKNVTVRDVLNECAKHQENRYWAYFFGEISGFGIDGYILFPRWDRGLGKDYFNMERETNLRNSGKLREDEEYADVEIGIYPDPQENLK